MTEKLEAVGTKGGFKWDDGSDHDGVAKIYVRGGPHGIQSIRFDYVDKYGQRKGGVHFGDWGRGFTETFEINHLNNEHLESVEVTHDALSGYIQGLQFKTNFRVSELIGYDKGTKFTLAVKGKKITSFYIYMNWAHIISLGAYFTWVPRTRLEAIGSKRGKQWDHGTDHEGVRKIYVRGDRIGIQGIRVDYVRSEQQRDGTLLHSFSSGGFTQQFEINHLEDEHLIAVEGYYDDASGVIQALQFKTNIKTSKVMGYEKGRKFSLAANRQEIIGFHGYAEKNLNSLGAYFKTVSVTKSKWHGTIGSKSWDDGVFDSIRKVNVRYKNSYVRSIRFDYNDGNTLLTRMHGVIGPEEEFELDYPNELITSVEGTLSETSARLTSLVFKTSKGRTSPTFGHVSGKNLVRFVLERKGCALVGFHGREDTTYITAIGAYYYPLPPPTGEEKLEAHDGDHRGASWGRWCFRGC